jgi:hypothetical protein
MGSIYYVKFVFGDEELILDEFELIQLMKACKNRNKRLYKKFVKFYERVLSDDQRELFEVLE